MKVRGSSLTDYLDILKLGDPSNYGVREEETKRQFSGLMCKRDRLRSFTGGFCSFAGGLWSFAGGVYSFVLVCHRCLF